MGKSSLVNALAHHKGLARVSRTPGRTQLINFFTLRVRNPDGETMLVRCADLPGYGYAAAHRRVRDSFAPMIDGYSSGRTALRGLVLLIDVRRGITPLDLDLLALATDRKLPVLLVGTKADKLGASERGLVRRSLAEAVGVRPRDILLTSAATGLGIDRGPDRLVDDVVALATGELAVGPADDAAEDAEDEQR